MRYIHLRFPEGKEKALTLSYDDGVVYDKRLAEITKKYGIKITFNINSGFIGADKGRLTLEEIKELDAMDHVEIATHGENHRAPGRVAKIQGITDTLMCRRSLEKDLGKIVRGMAYPDSGIHLITNNVKKQEITSYLKDLGIAYARSLGADNNHFLLPTDWYEWIPTAHHNNPEMMNYLKEFLDMPTPRHSASQVPRLFYLWGHSYEFEGNNNWELIEEFCKTASGNPNVWYATNIEICDYVNAYYSLVYSADETMVYNPTLFNIWFTADGKLYKIKPGETLKIEG